MSLLQVENVRVKYGQVEALHGVDLKLNEGEFVGIIGRNGAGKTTTMRTIAGVHPLAQGSIRFDGKRIDQLKAHQIVELGIAMVPEGRRIFADLTVLENLKLGAFNRYLRREDRHRIESSLEKQFALFPILKERAGQLGGTLSGGQQEMLAIGRALMSEPRLLLLDEPSMGLAPIVVSRVLEAVSHLHQAGVTVLIVEQKAFLTLKLVQRAYVLNNGLIVKSGTGQELLGDPEIHAAYLGEQTGALAT
jgi:branched-chain amino acid transport system ATP-binding protein